MIEIVEPISQASTYDYMSWAGTVISVVGAVISIYQSFKIRKYRNEIIADLRKMTMHKAYHLLKKAQDDCRKLLNKYRGQNPDDIYDSIQENIDLSISELNQEDSDSDILKVIQASDKELKAVREHNGSANNLHEQLGKAIIRCNQIIGEVR